MAARLLSAVPSDAAEACDMPVDYYFSSQSLDFLCDTVWKKRPQGGKSCFELKIAIGKGNVLAF